MGYRPSRMIPTLDSTLGHSAVRKLLTSMPTSNVDVLEAVCIWIRNTKCAEGVGWAVEVMKKGGDLGENG